MTELGKGDEGSWIPNDMEPKVDERSGDQSCGPAPCVGPLHDLPSRLRRVQRKRYRHKNRGMRMDFECESNEEAGKRRT